MVVELMTTINVMVISNLHKLLYGVTVREIQTMIGRIFLFVSKIFENSWSTVAITVSVNQKSLFR